MKKTKLTLFSLFIFVSLSTTAFAHEKQIIKIGETDYIFNVGFINEPVAIDDKSGLELELSTKDKKPVDELESKLKVEVSAGEAKSLFDLKPSFDNPGVYKAVFFPTIATTYNFRLQGEINDIPVDIPFSCNSAGHPKSEDDTSSKELSINVIRTLKSGSFGCPIDKSTISFPEKTGSSYYMQGKIYDFEKKLEIGNGPNNLQIIFGLISVAALILSSIALMRSHKHK